MSLRDLRMGWENRYPLCCVAWYSIVGTRAELVGAVELKDGRNFVPCPWHRGHRYYKPPLDDTFENRMANEARMAIRVACGRGVLQECVERNEPFTMQLKCDVETLKREVEHLPR